MPGYSVSPSSSPGGGIVSTAITTPGDVVTVTFAGTAGHRISIQINSMSLTGGGGGAADFAITNPDSSAGPTDSKNAATVLFDYVLPQTGTYTLTMTPWTSGTGTADLEFYTSVDDTDTVTPVPGGTPLSVTLATPGQQEIVSFPGTAGESVTIAESSWALGSKVISWIRPDGSTYYTDNLNHNATATGTLDATGTWKFVISTYMGNPGRDAYGTVTLTFTGTGATIISHEYDLTGGQTVSRSGAIARTFSATQAQAAKRAASPRSLKVSQGQLVVIPGVTQFIFPNGLGSGEAFGEPGIGVVQILEPFGIGSGERLGSLARVLVEGPQTVSPSAIASGEAVEVPTVTRDGQEIRPSGIGSSGALGTPTAALAPEDQLIYAPASIGTGELFGRPALSTGPSSLALSGIPSSEAFGTPILFQREVHITPRNYLIDRKTGEVYPWPVNHASEDPIKTLGRRLTRSGITASGKLLSTRKVFLNRQPSHPGPVHLLLHGSFIDHDQGQFRSFLRFFNESDDRTFDYLDASGDSYHVAVVQFDARRKISPAYTDGNYFTYTLEVEVLEVNSGALKGYAV